MSIRDLARQKLPVTAPLVLNPLMARMAEQAGFKAGYVGGGALGYLLACLEANLMLSELCSVAVQIRAASSLELILDGACGFGDAMHVGRTVGMAEAAGFSAIEIEDQVFPKRAHHHVGVEHMVDAEVMAGKVREAIRARRSEDFLIIARTNGMRASNFDDALHRGEAYREAGADVIFPALTYEPEHLRAFARRIGGPLMFIAGRGGLAGLGMTLEDLADLGYMIVAEAMTPVVAAFEAWHAVYQNLADAFGANGSQQYGGAIARGPVEKEVLSLIGLDEMLQVEMRTVGR